MTFAANTRDRKITDEQRPDISAKPLLYLDKIYLSIKNRN